MSTHAKTMPQQKMQKPAPEGCTDVYLAGWAYADWYVTNGGSLDADTPDSWPEEKNNGFCDYLAQALREKATA
jgi:hypothetical protein